LDEFGRQDGVRKANDFFVELCLNKTKAPTPFPATKDPLDRLLYRPGFKRHQPLEPDRWRKFCEAAWEQQERSQLRLQEVNALYRPSVRQTRFRQLESERVNAL
jgi:hypothetical protein